ncbi:hypothetical protein D3C76_1417730 [compost metagenome]
MSLLIAMSPEHLSGYLSLITLSVLTTSFTVLFFFTESDLTKPFDIKSLIITETLFLDNFIKLAKY